MSSAAPSHVQPADPGPHGRHGLSGNTLRPPRPIRPAAGLSVVPRSPMVVPVATAAEIDPSYPQVPPESPLPMHARAFDFVGVRDLFGFLTETRRQRPQPALATVPPSVTSHG